MMQWFGKSDALVICFVGKLDAVTDVLSIQLLTGDGILCEIRMR